MTVDLNLGRQVSRVLHARQDELAEAIVARHYERQPQLWKPFGDEGRQKSVRDTKYHLTYLLEAIAAQEATLFTEYLAWVKALFVGLGFPAHVVPSALLIMQETLRENLEADEAAVVDEYIAAGLAHFAQAPETPPGHLAADAPLGDLAQTYLDYLLAGQRQLASRLVLEAVSGGASVKQIYRHVFQPVQREIGRLWQMNRVTVAQEHYCTAATQLIMSQLYPFIFSEARVGRSLVATAVDGELHEIGVRMVADFFEMEGWDTYYMGANVPAADILNTLAEQEAHLLAISATIPAHTGKVRRLIATLRESEVGSKTLIVVGGYPFNQSPQLWRSVGADGYASDADEALEVAAALLEGHS